MGGETAGLVARLSLAQSVSRGHAGARLQKATQQSAGLLHSISACLLADTEDGGCFGRKDTLQGTGLSRGGKNPPDGRDEELQQQQQHLHLCTQTSRIIH